MRKNSIKLKKGDDTQHHVLNINRDKIKFLNLAHIYTIKYN